MIGGKIHMNEEWMKEEITLTKAELMQICRDSYQNGFEDSQRIRNTKLGKQQEDQFNYDTIIHIKNKADRY